MLIQAHLIESSDRCFPTERNDILNDKRWIQNQFEFQNSESLLDLKLTPAEEIELLQLTSDHTLQSKTRMHVTLVVLDKYFVRRVAQVFCFSFLSQQMRIRIFSSHKPQDKAQKQAENRNHGLYAKDGRHSKNVDRPTYPINQSLSEVIAGPIWSVFLFLHFKD